MPQERFVDSLADVPGEIVGGIMEAIVEGIAANFRGTSSPPPPPPPQPERSQEHGCRCSWFCRCS